MASKPWLRFWKSQKSVEEHESAEEANESGRETKEVYEMNSRLPSGFMYVLNCGNNRNSPYSTDELIRMAEDPMHNIVELRRWSRWAYYTNGTVSSAIDSICSFHSLEYTVTARPKKDGVKRKGYRELSDKMNNTLRYLRYKDVIRNALFCEANDGMYVGYFETRAPMADQKMALTDYDIDSMYEINAAGMNLAVITLPVDYCKIIGRKRNCYEVAFDLRYFNGMTEETRGRVLRGMPKQIQEGWMKYTNGEFGPSECWLRLDWRKTIVTKIKSGPNDPAGVPFAVAALDDIDYANYFVNTKRRVLDGVNNRIYYETFPEGREKGTSALTKTQQQDQHNKVRESLTARKNSSGISFFSLAAGTKMDSLPVDTSLLDEDNENSIKEDVNKDIGVSGAALGGTSAGNYATATLNLELISNNVYTWIEDIVEELNKVLNYNVFRNSQYKIEFRILPITFLNRESYVKNLSDLYTRGKGSLSAWIAACGMNVDDYLSLMDYELDEDFENKYPVHKTSYTYSGYSTTGRRYYRRNYGYGYADEPSVTTTVNPGAAESTVNGVANNGNASPSPSDS